MRRSARARRAVRRRVAADAVGSRWWYWIAAVPATFGLWVVAVAWVGVAVGLGPLAGPNPLRQAVRISLVAFGVPFLVLLAVFPFAALADASAILAAEAEWRPPRARFVAGAAVGPLVAVLAGGADLLEDGSVDVLGWAVLAGFLLAVPVAASYLLVRHRNVGVP